MFLIPIILAAFFNAVMDLLENENFNRSVFSKRNKRFWYKRESWQHATQILGYKIDGWHLAKSLMIISMAAAIVLYKNMFNPILDVAAIGLVWNVSFNTFYEIMKR